MNVYKYLVSAIVSTYNSERFIRGRIDDLLNQSIGEKLEIIIINSGSCQNEDKIINEEYLPFYQNIKYLKTDNRETIYKAWNRGIRCSNGKYISNANTDDRLSPYAFEILTAALESSNDYGIAYADQYCVSQENIMFSKSINGKRIIWPAYSKLKLFSQYIVGPQSVWRASIHSHHNIWFNEKFEIAGDYDFICRVSEIFQFVKINKVLGLYYKSLSDSNKEYKEPLKTEQETYFVKEYYSQKYINGLSKLKFNSLYAKLLIKCLIPKCCYSIIHRILNIVAPQYQLLPKIFNLWLLSMVEEKRGNLNKAILYASQYRNNPSAGVLHRRLELLLENIRHEK